jgi:glycosyltransferase involved in cell wall biosynthesis
MNNQNKKFGYFTEGVYFKNADGRVYTSDIFIIFINKLKLNGEITALGRLSKQDFSPKHQLRNMGFISLSYYKSLRSLIKIYPFYILRNLKKIFCFTKDIDLLLISASGPISVLLIWFMKIQRKKVIIFIRSDIRELIKAKDHNTFMLDIFANWIESSFEKSVKNNSSITAFAFGDDIFNRYSKFSNSVISAASSRFEMSHIISSDELSFNDTSCVNLLYVGRLSKGKGLNLLIETVSMLKSNRFKLTIIGDGDIKDELVLLVKNLGLNEKIIFKGYIPFGERLFKEYSHYDVLILPSFSEGLPQVILEAMARGVAVVASGVGGIKDLIKDGENGYMFDPGDKSTLLNILEEILAGDLPLLNIRRNGLTTAEKFSFEKQAEKIYNVLNQYN